MTGLNWENLFKGNDIFLTLLMVSYMKRKSRKLMYRDFCSEIVRHLSDRGLLRNNI